MPLQGGVDRMNPKPSATRDSSSPTACTSEHLRVQAVACLVPWPARHSGQVDLWQHNGEGHSEAPAALTSHLFIETQQALRRLHLVDKNFQVGGSGSAR